MADVELRPYDAIRVLTRIRDRVIAEIRANAETRTLPTGWGSFQNWVLAKEEELAILEASMELFRPLPASTIVARAEGTA